jgi:aminoglycoside phosphotransferase (APT) family kinase protein
VTLADRIGEHLRSATRAPCEVVSVELLAGGACQENHKVVVRLDAAPPRTLVLRADSPGSLPGSLGRAVEARVIGAAVAAGVKTPAARWPVEGLTRPGAWAYFLDWIDGEAIGRRVVKGEQLAAARAALPEQLAAELARIHSVTPATHPDLFAGSGRLIDTDPNGDPAGVILDDLAAGLGKLPRARPASEAILAWLVANKPAPGRRTLAHGDFRVGNFLVGPEGLTAILDWEFARFATPAEDLAWIAVRDWRFGRLDKPIGGIGPRAPFYEAYERASGTKLDAAELRYWEILGNLRWAVGSLAQGRRYVAGERDIELLAVARRATEMEYEALRLIERGV